MPLVETLFPRARESLVTLGGTAPVTAAAKLLSDKKHRLVVVCNPQAKMIGVVARRDVVREISHCLGCACTMACGTIMTTDVITCHPSDPLRDVWETMVAKGLRSIPIVDELDHPLGVAAARDTAEVLLSEVAYDQSILTQYVMSLGYR